MHSFNRAEDRTPQSAMSIEDYRRDAHIDGSSDRVFGLVFAAFFLAVACFPLFSGDAVRLWALGLGSVFLAFGLFWPSSLATLNRLWMKFGLLLGEVVSPIALGIVFYFTILPIGFLMRQAGKDPLRLKYNPMAESYWIIRDPPGPDPKTLEKQF